MPTFIIVKKLLKLWQVYKNLFIFLYETIKKSALNLKDPLLKEGAKLYIAKIVAHPEFNKNIRHFYTFVTLYLKFQIFIKFFECLKLIHTYFENGMLIFWFIYLFIKLFAQIIFSTANEIERIAIFSFLFFLEFQKNCTKD